MIKKILPALIGAALVGGVANATADVTAMGHIDTAVVYSDPGGFDSNGKPDSTSNLVCTTCSFGFKGSEDLGNGLSAIFKIDFQYDTTERNNTSGLTDRDQWLGLKGDVWGQVRIGTISTVYKSHGAMLDPIYRTVVQGRDIGLQSRAHAGAGENGQGRATNTFRYDSPSFAGFQVGAHYTLQSDNGGATKDPWGIGGQWKGGGFLVFADYITNDASGGDDDAWKVGGRFGFDKFAVFGQYESDGGLISADTGLQGVDPTTGGPDGVGEGLDVWFIGGTAGFGNNTIYAAYGQGDDSNAVAFDTGYDSWNIVGVHSFSKRTLAYFGFAQISPDQSGADNVDNWTLGMKHTF